MIRLLNLLVIIFLIWFLNGSFQKRQVKVIGAKEILGTEKTPDYYSENLQLRQFNEQGKLQSLIKTQRLTHFPDQHYTEVTTPELVLYGEQEGIADGIRRVTSTTGEISDASRDLKLIDDVLLVVSDKNNQQKMKITTSQLLYKVAQQQLWTERQITAQSSHSNFTATGLQFDVKTDQIVLDKEVNIHYDL